VEPGRDTISARTGRRLQRRKAAASPTREKRKQRAGEEAGEETRMGSERGIPTFSKSKKSCIEFNIRSQDALSGSGHRKIPSNRVRGKGNFPIKTL